MAGRKRSKRKGKGTQLDLEALGLVLLALGVFVLGLLLPWLPTGELGRQLRGWMMDRVGWGAWALPWPLLVLGGAFLLRRNPRAWPRRLLGYLILSDGLWALLVLMAPRYAGSWGAELRSVLAGAAGWLAYLPALFLVSLGVELLMGLPPTLLARSFSRRLLRLLKNIVRTALSARKRAKDRAAFFADVALERRALSELDKDLLALAVLYPGSAEIEKWRKAVAASRKRLDRLSPEGREVLEDVSADVEAWRTAVLDFARDRASELQHSLAAEGIRDFDAWYRGLKAQLDDLIGEPGRVARALDEVRKTLALDLTALAERYRRLTRERDLGAAALDGMTPRQLAAAFEEHGRRLSAYRRIEADAEQLEADAEELERWREFSSRLLRLAAEFPDYDELAELTDTLAGELRSHGREVLAQREGWVQALEAVELRAREDALMRSRGAASGEPGEVAEGAFGAAGQAAGAAADLQEILADDDAFDRFAAAEAEAAALLDADALDARTLEADALEAEALGAAGPGSSERGVPAGNGPITSEGNGDGAEVKVRAAVTAVEALPEVGGIPIQLPDVDLLDAAEVSREEPTVVAQEVQERVRKIDETLANFNLQGRVVSSVRGPTVTRFEVEPAPGEKISRFANLSDDLALAMAVGSVRIEAPIPGKSVIGLEVPNARRDLIRFREAAMSQNFRRSKARLPLILGKSIDGEMVVRDLAKMPHLLIAGSTGSGKSVAVNTLIGSLLYKFLPTELRFLMIDPKMVELTPFDGVPHLLRPVVTNPGDAAGVLLGAVAHMERRYKMMSKIGAKNLDQYNEKARNLDMPAMPFIVIVIDELADLMITSPKEVESAIMRLAQMARATGMHLVLATQRPSVDILTSLIKVNVPARMAFAVSSGHDSRTILDTMGAERLVGMGDMLFYQPGMVKPMRLQGPFVNETEINNLAAFLRRQYFDDEFVEAYGADFDPPSLHESDASGLIDWNDDKLRVAAELVIQEGQASVSRLQRRLQVGHARAGKLMDSLEALGVVGPHVGSKPREVLVGLEELPNIFGK